MCPPLANDLNKRLTSSSDDARDNQSSGIIKSPRHGSHPDCRAPLIQIDAPHTARAGTHPRAVRRRCGSSPPSSSGLARARQGTPLGSAVYGALGTHEGAFTLVPSPGPITAPLWKAHASGFRQRPRLSSPTPLLATRHARPVESRMAFTPATGTWPNPSFEATSSGKLRLPTAAPQLKR